MTAPLDLTAIRARHTSDPDCPDVLALCAEVERLRQEKAEVRRETLQEVWAQYRTGDDAAFILWLDEQGLDDHKLQERTR